MRKLGPGAVWPYPKASAYGGLWGQPLHTPGGCQGPHAIWQMSISQPGCSVSTVNRQRGFCWPTSLFSREVTCLPREAGDPTSTMMALRGAHFQHRRSCLHRGPTAWADGAGVGQRDPDKWGWILEGKALGWLLSGAAIYTQGYVCT